MPENSRVETKKEKRHQDVEVTKSQIGIEEAY